MHYLYIIYSESTDKYYIGETYNIEERIRKHNSHEYGGAFTKIASDWKPIFIFGCTNENEAAYLEAFIKKMKSRNFILKIINTPEILHDILSKRK